MSEPFDDFCALLSPCGICANGVFMHPVEFDDEGDITKEEPGPCPACDGTGFSGVAEMEALQHVLDRLVAEGCDPVAVAYGCNCKPSERTGNTHAGTCPCFETECTCYEVIGGHQMGCAFYGRAVSHG